MRVALPPRTRDLPVSTVELVERAASEQLQNGEGDGRRSQLSFEGSRQGMVVPCREGNGTQEHTTETVSAPELSASGAHGAMGLCVLASLPRRLTEQRRSGRTAAYRADFRGRRLGLSCSDERRRISDGGCHARG